MILNYFSKKYKTGSPRVNEKRAVNMLERAAVRF